MDTLQCGWCWASWSASTGRDRPATVDRRSLPAPDRRICRCNDRRCARTATACGPSSPCRWTAATRSRRAFKQAGVPDGGPLPEAAAPPARLRAALPRRDAAAQRRVRRAPRDEPADERRPERGAAGPGRRRVAGRADLTSMLIGYTLDACAPGCARVAAWLGLDRRHPRADPPWARVRCAPAARWARDRSCTATCRSSPPGKGASRSARAAHRAGRPTCWSATSACRSATTSPSAPA